MSQDQQVPKIDVPYLAQLARIALNAEQVEKFGAQLQQIVSYVEKLKEVNVEGIEPTAHATPITNVFRPDEPRTPGDSAPFLKNAPQQANNLFVVPKIVE
ncbi:MAG: asparaginyl/glutamyl-tRNA amidotransferase subunit C [Verrucomicrobia bacterium GWF2_62_7]|nr:MAG: asparaginyl/glutamyl-tRNA amidotransferase subunit C [Verrucomicrobia bacterium GWF2_62_7]